MPLAEELAARLTASARPATSAATSTEIGALRHYQALGRGYELVNQFLRGELPRTLVHDEIATVREIVDGLDRLMARWRTPEPIRAFRGLRSRRGVDLSGGPFLTRSFLSCSSDRDVAVREFTEPASPSGPALLEISVPKSVPGIWVPPLGDPDLAYQGELLLPRGVALAVGSAHDQAGILVVDCEVQP